MITAIVTILVISPMVAIVWEHARFLRDPRTTRRQVRSDRQDFLVG